MKEKLYCKIFGHDFRTITETYDSIYVTPSDYCRHCGLSKKDIMKK